MVLHSTEIKMTIKCKDERLAMIIAKTLEPENKLLEKPTEIKTSQKDKKVIIEVHSSANISSLRYTIDDIIHTLSIIENVQKSATSNDK